MDDLPAASEAADELAAMSYEELVEALEAITTKMAAGDIGIEAVADLYERAGQLHAHAAARLDRVRERIEGLAAGDEGAPTVEP